MAIGAAFGMMSAFFMGGLYVAGALGAVALILMKFFNISNPNLWNIMGNRAWEGSTNFILIAIPLFILMGELVLRSGVAERMYNVLSRWLVFIPGGLIHSNIASCAISAAGGKMEDVAKITCFITDITYYPGYSKVRAETWPKDPPASSTVVVAGLVRPEFLVEVEAIVRLPG